jgi:SOS-response transcriptional repressor LexA
MRYDGRVADDPPTRGRRPAAPITRWWIAVVRGRSMLPTLRDGDRLLVRAGTRGARPGRVAVIRLPGRPLSVKRLAFREPSGWWVERDNPQEGVDSWNAGIGTIPHADVIGVAVARLWPHPRRL